MEATEEMAMEEAEATAAPEEMAMGGVDSLCLITDVGRVNDGTFNQYAHEGALRAQEDFDLEYTFIETEAETDYASNIQTCVDEGFDVIVTVGFLIQDATAEAAVANPDIYFVGIDQYVVDGPENFVGIQFREDQAGFLVGVMAALVANENDSDVIAGVYGIDVPAVKRYRNGYEQGALYVNPEWEVGTNILGAYADSFSDQAQGVSLAQQFIGEGASVIFGAGGPLGSAAIAEAASQGIFVIGVDQDEYFTTFDNGSGEGAEFLITSALKRVDQGVYDMVAAVVEGRMEDFPGGNNYLLDAERAGVGFAEAHDAAVSEDITAQVNDVLAGLVDGSISTGVDPVSGDLEAASDEAAMEATAEATAEAE
ncbi:MAG: BMP family ABC transporter substrate-binding protein, partial [Anaerolineae bacterium]|nr:BMP family ABC transporter substrate-binding protein [Anaerolineae bacterium]